MGHGKSIRSFVIVGEVEPQGRCPGIRLEMAQSLSSGVMDSVGFGASHLGGIHRARTGDADSGWIALPLLNTEMLAIPGLAEDLT